jgi:hypothetical protein
LLGELPDVRIAYPEIQEKIIQLEGESSIGRMGKARVELDAAFQKYLALCEQENREGLSAEQMVEALRNVAERLQVVDGLYQKTVREKKSKEELQNVQEAMEKIRLEIQAREEKMQ